MKLAPFAARARSAVFQVLRQHPLTMLFAVAGSAYGIAFTWHSGIKPDETLVKLPLVLWLGIPVSLAADLIAHFAPALSVAKRMAIRIAPVLLIAGAWIAIRPLRENLFVIRFVLWGVAAHCLVAVSPFLGSLG